MSGQQTPATPPAAAPAAPAAPQNTNMDSVNRGLGFLNSLGNLFSAAPAAPAAPASPEGGNTPQGGTPPVSGNSFLPQGTGTPPQTPPPGQAPAAPQQTPPAADQQFQPYDLVADQNSVLGPNDVKAIQTLLHDGKINKDVGEKVFKHYEGVVKQVVDAAANARVQQISEWAQELQKDPEIVNELGRNQQIVQRYLADKSPGLIKVLQETGLMNNAHVIKYFIAEGKKVLDDVATGHGTPRGPELSTEDAVKKMYAGKM